jgi:hypothetical protein
MTINKIKGIYTETHSSQALEKKTKSSTSKKPPQSPKEEKSPVN